MAEGVPTNNQRGQRSSIVYTRAEVDYHIYWAKNESVHSVHISVIDVQLMKFNNVMCFQFSNHFLMSLHAPKSIDPARLRYTVGKSAQGSNPSHSWIFNKVFLDFFFSKTKDRTKAGGYVNVPSSPLTPSISIWSVAHQSFRRIIVRFVSWDSKSNICKCHSKTSKTCPPPPKKKTHHALPCVKM